MMSFSLSGGVEVLGFISPTDPLDTYPVIDPLYGIDGFRNVDLISDLDLIPNSRRRAGMVVGVSGGTEYYKLNPSPWSGTISDWSLFTSGGTFTGNTSATCISDIFVSNIHSCSPLKINPLDEGNVYFGSTSAVTIDLLNNSIGISTPTPTAKLHINNTTSGNTFLAEDSTNPDSTPFVIDSIGRVGIGTPNPGSKVVVYDGDAFIWGGSSGNTGLRLQYGLGYSFWVNTPTGNTMSIGGIGSTAPSTGAININNLGNVGIGMDLPTAKLHITNTGTSNSFLVEDDTNPDLTPFVIDSIGRVGIGTTGLTSFLTVNAPASASTNESIARFRVGDANNSYFAIDNAVTTDNVFVPGLVGRQDASTNQIALIAGGYIDTTQDSGTTPVTVFRSAKADLTTVSTRPLFDFRNWTTSVMTIAASGNVGVGIETPTAKLHINNTGTTNTFLAEDSTNPDSTPFVIDASGNTGIGTTSPTYLLDINGVTRHRNNVLVDNGSLIYWSDQTGVWPTSINNKIRWTLNNDIAEIYAFQPRTDKLDLVFKVADNVGGSAGDEFVYWVDSFNGEQDDSYPLLMGQDFIVNPTRRYALSASTSGAGNTDFYILQSGATALTQSVIFADVSTGNVGIGTTSPTKKLDVLGDARISGTGQNILTLIGSGNSTTSPLFTVQGSSGELFSVSDNLIGSLFSVNNISGLPVLEAFSDDTILMGTYSAPSLNSTAKVIATTGTTNIFSIPTSAYTGAFFDYTISDGTNLRAGNIMSIWSGTSVNMTEVQTTSFGSTTGLTFDMVVSSGNAILRTSGVTGNWIVKTIVRSI